MKIELWIDYLCPLTYKVHQNLIETIKQQPDAKSIEVLYRSYELIPKQQLTHTPLVSYLSVTHLMEESEILSYCKCIAVDISDLKVVDVKPAHQMSHLAKHKGLAGAMNQKLFEAYFEHKLDISHPDVLVELGLEIGLKEDDILETLNQGKYIEAIDLNRENALLKGIHNIPHMRVDGKHKLEGYIQVFDMKQAIAKAKNPDPMHKEHCEGENCERKKTR
jgi:predicted DsbA family dithiol-disulfide isomerase